jgi:hypothetical protein
MSIAMELGEFDRRNVKRRSSTHTSTQIVIIFLVSENKKSSVVFLRLTIYEQHHVCTHYSLINKLSQSQPRVDRFQQCPYPHSSSWIHFRNMLPDSVAAVLRPRRDIEIFRGG